MISCNVIFKGLIQNYGSELNFKLYMIKLKPCFYKALKTKPLTLRVNRGIGLILKS